MLLFCLTHSFALSENHKSILVNSGIEGLNFLIRLAFFIIFDKLSTLKSSSVGLIGVVFTLEINLPRGLISIP